MLYSSCHGKATLLLLLLLLLRLLLLLLLLLVLLLSPLVCLDPGIWQGSLYLSWIGYAAAFVFAQVGLRQSCDRNGRLLLASNPHHTPTYGILAPILDWILCCHADEGLAAPCVLYAPIPLISILR